MSRARQFANVLDQLSQPGPEDEQPIHVPTLERYWRDPEFAREQDAERAEWQRQTNRLIDEGVRKARARLSEKDQPNA